MNAFDPNDRYKYDLLEVVADLHALAIGSLQADVSSFREQAEWLAWRLLGSVWTESTWLTDSYDRAVYRLAVQALGEWAAFIQILEERS